MAVRHSSPSGSLNKMPRPRTVCGESMTYGWPPDSENRPIIGMRPARKTEALDSAAPRPLLSKCPLTQTPLAWWRRKPGCNPFRCSNLFIIDAGVSACGVNQPPIYANKPAIPAITTPIAVNRMIRLALVNSARPVGDDSSDSLEFIQFPSIKQPTFRRNPSANQTEAPVDQTITIIRKCDT